MESLLYARFVAPFVYFCAVVAYVQLLKGTLKISAHAAWLFRAGLGVHLVEILARGAEAGAAGGAPFVGLSGFVSVFAFLLGLVYLSMELRYKEHSLGAFHTSVVFVLQLAAAVTKAPMDDIPQLKTGYLLILHVLPAAIAYAALTASFIAAIAYLLLDRALRKKRRGLLMRGLPNLELVEAVNTAGVKLGLPLLLIGATAGLAMGYREWGGAYQGELKNWVTFVIIAIYSAQLLARRFAGWTGRRSVIMSVVGFFAMIVGVTIINMFFSDLHGGF